MDFEALLQILLPIVFVCWLILAIRQRSERKTWFDNIYLSLLCIFTGGLFGMPRLVSIVTMGLYSSGILIHNPDSVVVYNGIPFLASSGGFFNLIGEWMLILMFFFGLYLLVYTLVRRAKGDRRYE